jgi:hypothetical protein
LKAIPVDLSRENVKQKWALRGSLSLEAARVRPHKKVRLDFL